MATQCSQWQKSFLLSPSDEELEGRLFVGALPLHGLLDPDVEYCVQKVDETLCAVHVASEQEIPLVRRIFGMGRFHAEKYYPTDACYRCGRSEKTPFIGKAAVAVLTGEAGTGKTELLKAVQRLLPTETVDFGGKFREVKIRKSIRVEIPPGSGVVELLNAVSRAADSPIEFKDAKIASVEQLQRELFALGICLVFADEIQFATASSDANAKLALLVMMLSRFGVPVVLSLNYSAVRLLKLRPEQEIQRFLRRPMILLPELATDKGFQKLLEEYVRAFGSALKIDVVKHALALNALCGGKKRLLKELMECAYLEARRR